MEVALAALAAALHDESVSVQDIMVCVEDIATLIYAGQRPAPVPSSFPFPALFAIVASLLTSIATAEDEDSAELYAAQLETAALVLDAMLRGAVDVGPRLLLNPSILPSLLQAVALPVLRLRKLGLAQLDRLASDASHTAALLEQEPAVAAVLWSALADSDLGIAADAATVIKRVAAHASNDAALVAAVFAPAEAAVGALLASPDATVRFRAIELLLDFGGASAAVLSYARQAGWLAPFLAALSSEDDPLAQVTALELAGRLAATAHGLAFMLDSGLMTRFASLLLRSEGSLMGFVEEPLVRLVMPHLLSFGDDALRLALAQWMQTHDGDELGLTATGLLLCSEAGVSFVDSQAPAAATALAAAVFSDSPAPRLHALHCLGHALQSGAPLEGFTVSTLPGLVPHLMTLAGRPFPDERVGLWAVVRGLALHRWGLALLVAQQSLLALLRNGASESGSKHATAAKVAALEAIAGAPWLAEMVGADAAAELERLARGGTARAADATVAMATRSSG